MRINFSEVEAPEEIKPMPRGKYNFAITGVEEDEVKNGANAGCPLYKIELTVTEGEYENRKVWDNMSLIPPYQGQDGKPKKGTYWRVQQLLNATGIDASEGDLDLEDLDGEGTTLVEHLDGQNVTVELNYVGENTDPKTGNTYKAKNTVKRYIAGAEVGTSALP